MTKTLNEAINTIARRDSPRKISLLLTSEVSNEISRKMTEVVLSEHRHLNVTIHTKGRAGSGIPLDERRKKDAVFKKL